MGCSACEARANAAANSVRVAKSKETVNSNTECEFTLEQVDQWLAKVQCVLDQTLYIQIPSITKKQLRSYIGILLSAKNYADNVCYFRNELDEIENFITILIAKNLCNN